RASRHRRPGADRGGDKAVTPLIPPCAQRGEVPALRAEGSWATDSLLPMTPPSPHGDTSPSRTPRRGGGSIVSGVRCLFQPPPVFDGAAGHHQREDAKGAAHHDQEVEFVGWHGRLPGTRAKRVGSSGALL